MLVAQALESFYIWTRIRPEFKEVLRVVTNYIKRGKYA
jgi:shikimate 5-dehydrogenase